MNIDAVIADINADLDCVMREHCPTAKQRLAVIEAVVASMRDRQVIEFKTLMGE